jgi:hypothetical protein
MTEKEKKKLVCVLIAKEGGYTHLMSHAFVYLKVINEHATF